MSKEFSKTFKFASFSSVSDHNIKKFEKKSSLISCKWHNISPGLSVSGKCKNFDCPAYNDNVWTTLGFGSFNIAEWIRKTPCVSCGKHLKKVQSAVIYKCHLVGKGQKAI